MKKIMLATILTLISGSISFAKSKDEGSPYSKVVLEKISFKSDSRVGYYDVGLKGDIVIQQGCHADARKYDIVLISLREDGTERVIFTGKGKDFISWNPPAPQDVLPFNGSIPVVNGSPIRSSMVINIDRVSKTLDKPQSGPHFIPFKAQIIQDTQIKRLCRDESNSIQE